MDCFEFFNEKNETIDYLHCERQEQVLALKYVPEDSCGVLELGARYGTVTCTISHKINRRPVLICVEPDYQVFDVLRKNIERNNAVAHIIPYVISNKSYSLISCEYGSYVIPFPENLGPEYKLQSYSLQTILEATKIPKIDTLVADCEGFLEDFFDENPNLYTDLKVLIYEADGSDRCNYPKIEENLIAHGFRHEVKGFQNVWLKT